MSTLADKLAILNNAEKYWTYKMGLRVTLIVFNIIGIGAVSWLMQGHFVDPWWSYYDFSNIIPAWAMGSVVTLCVSLAYCLLAVAIPFMLRPIRPMHPGIAVGMDMCFWGAFLFLVVISLFAVMDATAFGSNGYISDFSYFYNRNYSGNYILAGNGTWIYRIMYANGAVWNSTIHRYQLPDDVNLDTIPRVCSPRFESCAQQDQYVNDVWHEKPERVAGTILVHVAQWMGTLISCALFIWACVDTHRYRKRSRMQEQAVTKDFIADFEGSGIVSGEDGSVKEGPHTSINELDEKEKERKEKN